MIKDLGKRKEAKIEKMQEMFNKDLEGLKSKHLEELKNRQVDKYVVKTMKVPLN